MFHKAIFDHYIAKDGSQDPGRPPYYSKELIKIIKEAYDRDKNIETLSLKDWYNRILERDVTHNSNGDGLESILIES